MPWRDPYGKERGLGESSHRGSLGGRLASLLGGEGDDGEVVLGDTPVRGHSRVDKKRRVGDERLLEDGKGGVEVEGGDHLSFNDHKGSRAKR
jgi:hypothetical protein